MKSETKISIESSVLQEMNRILSLDKGLEDTKNGNTIQTFYADFEDGTQADIKVCNGSEDSSPWIDAVLFDEDGNEITCFIADSETLDGEYIFFYGDDEYVVEVNEALPG